MCPGPSLDHKKSYMNKYQIKFDQIYCESNIQVMQSWNVIGSNDNLDKSDRTLCGGNTFNKHGHYQP